MDEPSPRPEPATPDLHRVGLVVHPTRPVDRALGEIESWASAAGATVGQVQIEGQTRRVADPVEAASCDLLLGLGGDGTALAALHAGAPHRIPVLGVALGSVGVLTSVSGDRLTGALEQIAAGRWTRVGIPGLDITGGDAPGAVAINDAAVVRDGPGQILVSVSVDDVLYARIAGDGIVVATPLGSTAYAMAAGGPILAPGADGMVVSPLAAHGGSFPPLVAGVASRLTLTVEPGFGGARCEVDGRPMAISGHAATIRHQSDYAALVALAGEEPRLAGLRRRGLVLDSPRALMRETRSAGRDGAS
jgi:NAD+ kinase